MLLQLLGFFTLLLVVFVVVQRLRHISKRQNGKAATMVVIGSGGHTAEMLSLMKGIDLTKYTPVCFLMAATDKISHKNVLLSPVYSKLKDPQFVIVPRAREVGQSWISTCFTTAIALFYSFKFVVQFQPEVVLCNGPGTCVPVAASAFLLRVIGAQPCKLVFVESYARVETLSLSGKILYPIADMFLVQWQSLLASHPRATYLGRVC